MTEKKSIFTPVSEKEVKRAIVNGFSGQFIEYVECECLVIGGGASGLMAGRDIALKGVKTLIVERNNYIGGDFRIEGHLMNKMIVREPGHKIMGN
jgi:ribulose 1,5-bisphosphate synthetase/thiazole synthase